MYALSLEFIHIFVLFKITSQYVFYKDHNKSVIPLLSVCFSCACFASRMNTPYPLFLAVHVIRHG